MKEEHKSVGETESGNGKNLDQGSSSEGKASKPSPADLIIASLEAGRCEQLKQKLMPLPYEDKFRILSAEDYKAFKWAAANADIKALQFFTDMLQPAEVLKITESGEHMAFKLFIMSEKCNSDKENYNERDAIDGFKIFFKINMIYMNFPNFNFYSSSGILPAFNTAKTEFIASQVPLASRNASVDTEQNKFQQIILQSGSQGRGK